MKQDKTDEKREDTSMKENNVLIFRIINQVYYFNYYILYM